MPILANPSWDRGGERVMVAKKLKERLGVIFRLPNFLFSSPGRGRARVGLNSHPRTGRPADPMIPRLAAGADAKLIGSTIVGLPWVLMGRKEIKRPQDLKGKTIALSRPGGLTDQLAKAVMKKFSLTTQEVKLLHIGGTGQLEPYNAMLQGLTQATFLTPPMDVRAKRDGFTLIYNLNELDVPSIYSSMFTNSKSLKERPLLVQRFVAALAEAIHFVEKHPDKGKAALAKILSISDQEV